MAFLPARSRHSDRNALPLRPIVRPATPQNPEGNRAKATFYGLMLGLALVSFALVAPPMLRAQSASPHITSVTPNSGKSQDTITITGENLGKSNVAAVFLSDDKLDHKAVVVEQEPTKIVIKVPNDLKPGNYNVSVQEGGAIYIQPVIFTVTT